MKKIKDYLKEHKIFVTVIAVIIIAAGYYFYQRSNTSASLPSYVLGTAQKGSVILSVSGSGQVSAVNQVDLKAEGSGKLISLKIIDGQAIKAGDIIATLNQKDNQLSITQAKASLLSAQANYKKVQDGTTADDIKLSQISVDQANSSYQSAITDLGNTKKSTAETVTQAEKDLNDLLDISNSTANNKRDLVLITIGDKIYVAKNALDHIKKIVDDDTADNALSVLNLSMLDQMKSGYDAAKSLLTIANSSFTDAKNNKSDFNLNKAVNETLSLLDKTDIALDYSILTLENSITTSRFTQSNLDSYKSSINSDISAISTAVSLVKTNWQNLKDAITTAENALTNAKSSAEQDIATAEAKVVSTQKSLENAKIQYSKTIAPATSDELESARVQVVNAQAQLSTAQTNYQKNIIKSPIDGIIADTQVKVGDDISSATIIASIITLNNIAEVSLNEVDAAKIKVGQKTILTFNAIEGLEITGTVSYINPIGAVSQGVVSYSVKIVFDIQDSRIKPGMSTSASIITDQRLGVITVPNSAIKSDNSGNYILQLDGAIVGSQTGNQPITSASAPVSVPVIVGLADDTNTEIISGLNAGDKIVATIINGSSSGASQSAPSTNRGGMGASGGGGIFRAIDGH